MGSKRRCRQDFSPFRMFGRSRASDTSGSRCNINQMILPDILFFSHLPYDMSVMHVVLMHFAYFAGFGCIRISRRCLTRQPAKASTGCTGEL